MLYTCSILQLIILLLISITVSTRPILGSLFRSKLFQWKDKYHRKVVIIGSGPAGSTAAIYSARAMLNPLQIAGFNYGGQLMLTTDVENFPGYRSAITGPELIDDLNFQARKFGSEIWQTDVLSIDFSQKPFAMKLHNCTITADAIILSTGANAVWLGADQETDFMGRGISTCATCDGYLFRDQTVIVIGGGDSAMEEANFLSRFAKEIIIVHRRSSFRASKIMLDRARRNPKVRFLCDAQVVRWLGTQQLLTGLRYRNTITDIEHELKCDGAFIAIGHKPNTAFLSGQVELDEKGYVVLKQRTMTSIPGVFACGDVADTRYRQAITAAGTGCQAAMDAERWLEEQ